MTKVAAIQMCSSSNIDENLSNAAKLIKEAAENGAKLIILPEMFAIFGDAPTDKVKAKEVFKTGKIQKFISSLAKENKVWIVSGTIPLECDEQNKIRAACIVYDDQGNIAARYDKIHLFDVTLSEAEAYKESDTTQAGNEIVTLDTPFGKLGLIVCYDLRFPGVFNVFLKEKVDFITVPAAFTVKTGEAHWSLLTRARAVENFCYVIGACQGGTHPNGRRTYGNSLIVDPWGHTESEKTTKNPGVIYANIDLEKINQIRKSIPVHQHQKNLPIDAIKKYSCK